MRRCSILYAVENHSNQSNIERFLGYNRCLKIHSKGNLIQIKMKFSFCRPLLHFTTVEASVNIRVPQHLRQNGTPGTHEHQRPIRAKTICGMLEWHDCRMCEMPRTPFI